MNRAFVFLLVFLCLIICFVFEINFVNADTQWDIEYELHGSGWCVINTNDGGYAIAGEGEGQFLFLKGDSIGGVQWEKTYGNGTAYSIIETSDGGYVLAANGNITKLDSTGNMQWTNACVVANSLIKTDDGGYLVAAGNGAALVKLDAEGSTEWSQPYQFQGARWSFFHSAIQVNDGSYVVAGVTYPVYDGLAWIIKVDETGLVEGEVTFPPETGINNRAYSIVEANDGGYVFTGSKNAENGKGKVWLAKIAPSAIPEFPSWLILPLFLVATAFALAVRKRGLHNISQAK